MKHHKNLNRCINDAIDFDDNCGAMDKKSEAKSYGASSSNSLVASQVEEITKGVMEKMQHLYGPPQTSEPRRVDRPYVCGNCGGNHPTSQCLPRAPGVPKLELHPLLWCDFDKKWGNHTTEECYNRTSIMRGQMMGKLPHAVQEGERPSPILERQSPLPKTTLVRLVEHDDEGGHERALVPVTSYGEEISYEPRDDKVDWSRTPHISLPEGQFNMDLNTLMFMAGQTRMPMVLKRATNLPLGPCYNCSDDHLI